jgi:predicted nucleic acid-binding protein
VILDASAAVELLQPSSDDVRATLARVLPGPAVPWLAPDVLTFEVGAVARRRLLRGEWPLTAAQRVVEGIQRLPVDLVDSRRMLSRAWELRDNLTIADALYVALAMASGESLLTTDARLAAAARALHVPVVGSAA